MFIKAQFYKHTLNFSFDAGTSRGVLKKKDSYFIKIFNKENPQVFGLGEAGPLMGLSLDSGNVARDQLLSIVSVINSGDYEDLASLKSGLENFPSVLFALETAILDFENEGKREIFKTDFFSSFEKIAINGLVWMGTPDFMQKQIIEKLENGFDTIKLKIGAIDFDEELKLLAFIRKQFSVDNITIRVDANGAFSPNQATEKLKRLSEFNIHSIEQPIKDGQEQFMASLCEKNIIPIALDEELIKNSGKERHLLETIKPQYIILKPTLMGGISGSLNWINTAESLNIKWWMTSALESNVGLNAICQLASQLKNTLPQGLGTGKLFTNNFESPLTVESGQISYDSKKAWNLDFFKSN
jgi:O-succinylbenzoate synthase